MKNYFLVLLLTAAVSSSGCQDEYREGAQTTGTAAATLRPASGNMDLYRQRADRAADQMAADLGLSPQARNRVQQAYLQRAIRMNEIRQRDNRFVSNRRAELNNNVGVGSNAGTNSATGARIGTPNPQKEEELQTLDQETAEKLREVLTPDQFSRYEANRTRYDQI
ncbi:hypothetical protein BH24BAC1_BH24BAC1_03830 [soil metagenome]